MKSILDAKVETAFNHAFTFYKQNGRSVESQECCIQQIAQMTGFDRATSIEIQAPVLSILMYNDTMDIANQVIQQHLNIVTGIIRDRLLDINHGNVQEEVKEQSFYHGSGLKTLGTSGDTAKHHELPAQSKQAVDTIRFMNNEAGQCWGSNALRDIKTINLANTDMQGFDLENVSYTLRAFNFNLEGILLDHNNIGDKGIHALINGITSTNYQTLYSAESGWKPISSPLNVVQSVVYLNLSYTNIGDFGAEIISNVIAGGQLPATRAIDVSGNNITEVGQGYFVDALQNLKQKIYITLVEAQEASKDVVQRTIKVLLDIAESNGVETREVVSTYDTIQHCKKGFPNVAKNIVGGLVSCVIPVAKYTNLEELTLQDVGTDLLAVIIPESAPYLEGACITEAIFFSIVDEDFANCLIGVDNHF